MVEVIFWIFLWGKVVKIAIVDDEAEARDALQQVLRTCGIELVAQADMQLFASGEEFLNDVQGLTSIFFHYSIILMCV